MKNLIISLWLIAICILLTPGQILAITFTDNLVHSFAVDIYYLDAGDIDSDGDIDIAAVSTYDGFIFWLENDGNQNFTPHTIASSALQPGYIKCIDMNNDGYMDLLSNCNPSSMVFWLENDGNQSFTEQIVTNSFTQVCWTECADLDNDNDLDVIASAHGPTEAFSWFENDGSMNFTEHPITTNITIFTISVADINDDGFIDIIPGSRNPSGNVWYENNGNSTFTENIISTATTDCYVMIPFDFDGDSDLDIIASQHDDYFYGWYEQQANSSFTFHLIDNSAEHTIYSEATDVDLDGDTDIIAKPFSPYTGINLYENDGSNNLTKTSILAGNTVESWASLKIVDLDSDGDSDFLWVSPSTDIRWAENDLDPTFALEITGTVQGSNLNSSMIKIIFDETATDGFDDGLDIPLPASPPGSFLQTYFYHPDWAGGLFGSQWMIDARDSAVDPITTLHTYDLHIETDQNNETVELTFTIPENWDTDFGVILHDPSSGSFQNLRTDNTFDYVADGATEELVLQVGDGNAPVITINSPSEDDLWYSNTSNNMIEWNVEDISQILSTDIEYSIDAGLNWTQITSIPETWPGAHSISWYVPNLYSVDVRIRITCIDAVGQSSTIESGVFQIAPGELDNNFAYGWHMLGIPLIPADNSNDSVLEDDINGSYFLYGYDSSSASYTISDTTFQGSGYWLLLSNPALIDVEGEPELDSMVVDMEQGWNIISSGFPITITRNELHFTDGINWYNFSDAVSNNFISSAFYGYDNSTGNYTSPAELDEWGGYWILPLLPALSMVVYPPEPGTYYELDDFDPEEGWKIPIYLRQNGNENSLSYFGSHINASSEFDNAFDCPAPPQSPSGNVLVALFEHPGWQSPAGNLFISDICGEIVEGNSYEWFFNIESSVSGPLNLSFDCNMLPDDISLQAMIEGSVYNLNSNPEINFDYSEPAIIQIIANSHMEVKNRNSSNTPEEYSIVSVTPNPFNTITTVEISLPENSELLIAVHNLLGQKVATIAHGFYSAGYKKFSFNASEFSSGIYIIHAYSPEKMNQLRKVMYIK